LMVTFELTLSYLPIFWVKYINITFYIVNLPF
jgi:hypothetical protein